MLLLFGFMNCRSSIPAGVLLSVFLVLAGCGGGGGGDQPATSPNTPSENPPSTPPGSPPGETQATGQPGRFDGQVRAIISAQDGTGEIYVAGDFTTYDGIAVPPVVRLTPTGGLNDTFALAGVIGPGITDIAAADDGSGDLYVGEVVFEGSRRGRIWRVNSDGAVDTSFSRGEVVLGDAPASWVVTQLQTIVPVGDGSGRVYVGGSFDRYNGALVPAIVRVNPNGTLDATFSSAGGAAARIIPANDGSGDIYVVSYDIVDFGDFSTTNLYRLNQDGSRDPAFSPVNVTSLQFTAAIRAVVPVGDGTGDLFMGGSFILDPAGNVNPLFDPTAIKDLARINPDGTRDRESPKPDATGSVYALARALDGTGDWFVAVADASTAGGRRLTRHRSDGTRDPQFTVGFLNGMVERAVLPVPDGTGDLYVGGRFSSYNGVTVGNLVRINGDGTLD